MKPKISKQLPAPFNAISKSSKPGGGQAGVGKHGKKGFQQFK